MDAVAPGVAKVRVSPAVKARASEAVRVSKVYAVTLRPMKAASMDAGPNRTAN